MSDLRRDFDSRNDLITYLKGEFPEIAEHSDEIPEMRGGRKAAEARLANIEPKAYSKTRNRLNGKVTRLSPYLRHGVLTLAEVRDLALEKVKNPGDAFKLIQELGWRDYFQRVYAQKKDDIWKDLEPYKTGFNASEYAESLPADIIAGETGTPIDQFVTELYETGYLHNHARMWTAAYVVHWRRVRWQAGAAWFLEHLLDGDPASNNLSWQWVASTFSHKPYFYNLDNLKKYGVKLQGYDVSPFKGSYEMLESRLFPNKG
ncbi:MAG: FAD-binding domain-containing protein [Chloroflexota bacterium]